MQILIHEFLTAGHHAATVPPSMVREGECMLLALCQDLIEVPGHSISLIRNRQLPPLPGSLEIHWISDEDDPEAQFRSLLRQVDAVWPIAPETNRILETLCREIEDHGKMLLSSPSKAVAITASKGQTHDILAAAGLPVVRTLPIEHTLDAFSPSLPLVFKADDGAGCENTIVAESKEEVIAFLESSKTGNWVVQPLMEGDPLSLTGLFNRGSARLLSVNRQKIMRQGQGFHLSGLSINISIDRIQFAELESLLQQIARAIPELWGLAGVDFLWNARGAMILEVNPRLTSAQGGLRKSLGLNPARLVLEMAQTGHLPDLPEGPFGSTLDLCLDTLQ